MAKFENATIQISEIPPDVEKVLKNIQAQIPTTVLNAHQDDEGWIEGGLQTLFHITVLYGKDNDSENVVEKILSNTRPIELKLGEIEYFDPEDEYSVVVLRVESEDLEKLHNVLREKLENEHRPGFKAHLTIAYINPKERLDNLNIEIPEIAWNINSLEISKSTGEVVNIGKEIEKKSFRIADLVAPHNTLIPMVDYNWPSKYLNDKNPKGHRPFLLDKGQGEQELKETEEDTHSLFFGPAFPRKSYKVGEYTKTKTFVETVEGKRATAELSEIESEIVQHSYLKKPVEGTWYYFNRLYVHPELRGKGIAKKLLQQVVDWADAEGISILNDVNPYGDLSLEELMNLYRKFGFKEIGGNFDATMIRNPKGSSHHNKAFYSIKSLEE